MAPHPLKLPRRVAEPADTRADEGEARVGGGLAKDLGVTEFLHQSLAVRMDQHADGVQELQSSRDH